jgi:CRP-like cAMP-binding protein
MTIQSIAPKPCDGAADIQTHGWLASCPAAMQDWLVGALRWRRVASGTTIMHGGDPEGAVWCVGEGQVAFDTTLGRPDIGLAFFALPGMWFGFLPLLGVPRAASAIACTDSLVGSIGVGAFRMRLAEHPGDWESIARAGTDNFVLAAGAHVDQLIPDSRRRLAAAVLRLTGLRHRRFPIRPVAHIVCIQEQLAGAAGISRNTAGKHIRQFEADGLIDCRYGRIAILDPFRLQAIADDG